MATLVSMTDGNRATATATGGSVGDRATATATGHGGSVGDRATATATGGSVGDRATATATGGSVSVSSGSARGGAGHVPDDDNPPAPPKQKNLQRQATGRLANLLDRTRKAHAEASGKGPPNKKARTAPEVPSFSLYFNILIINDCRLPFYDCSKILSIFKF